MSTDIYGPAAPAGPPIRDGDRRLSQSNIHRRIAWSAIFGGIAIIVGGFAVPGGLASGVASKSSYAGFGMVLLGLISATIGGSFAAPRPVQVARAVTGWVGAYPGSARSRGR